jgi:RNA polymerase sigma factor (sigma-70 family)
MTALAWPEPEEDWIQLYKDFEPRVVAWVKRRFGRQLRPASSPEDIWQDTFIRATTDLDLPQRPPAQICRFLLVIARNRCLSVIRGNRLPGRPGGQGNAIDPNDIVKEVHAKEPDPGLQAIIAEKRELFNQILLLLDPATSRPAFLGRFVDRRRYVALGREWGITANAAKKRAIKAKEEFRAIKARMGLPSSYFISRR